MRIKNIPTTIKREDLIKELEKYGDLDRFSLIVRPRMYTTEANFTFKDQTHSEQLVKIGKIMCLGCKLCVKQHIKQKNH